MARRFLLLCATAAAMGITTSPASAAPDCPGADTRLSLATVESARTAVLCLVNNERTSRGLNALTRDGRLELAAQLHSNDMVIRDFFGHVNPIGLDPFDRIELAGYAFSAAGENIAAGQPTAREAMEGWMASEGHCRNILNDGFTELGVGIDVLAATISRGTGTWAQSFGRPEDVARPANPDDVDDACPVTELATLSTQPGAEAEPAAPATPVVDLPGTGGDDPAANTDFPAGTPTRLTLALRRTARRLVVTGRLAAPDATRIRILIRQAGRTVFRTTAKLRRGRYRVRVKTPPDAGRLTVFVRAPGQRAARTSPGR